MRVLGLGSRMDLRALYLALAREGHEVRVHVSDPVYGAAPDGLVEAVPDWRAHLDWVGKGGDADGIVLFERVGQGALQDELRAEGYRVVGGSALGDRLEYDRAYGQEVLREAGLPVAPSHAFAEAAAAADWLGRNPGRFVLKHFNNVRATFVGEHRDGDDVRYRLRRQAELGEPGGRVLLMERIEGVEVGVGAYFDGERFLSPACIDFEHKRFFPGEIGEMTGEMGTLASYEGAERLFEAALAPLAPRLRAAGHVGYLNVNAIANERGLWPLEFTCRFGNPGFAVLEALQPDGWGDLLGRMARGDADGFATLPGWSVGIVLTVPPFPGEDWGAGPADNPPVFFHAAPDGADAAHYHFADMRRVGGQLHAHKRTGNAMVVTGIGADVRAAQAAAAARARNVVIPDLRWRADIGDRFLRGDESRLRALGWLPPALPRLHLAAGE